MPETLFHHQLDYPDNDGITLSDIAATLLAHERLIPLAAEVLERSIPGLTVENIRINLDFVRSGSLSEALFVAILIVYQKHLDVGMPNVFEKMTGVPIHDDNKPLLSVLIIILLYYGAKSLFERRGKTLRGAPRQIERELDRYMEIAADTLGIAQEKVERAIAETVTSKRRSW
jgi:hypothetical protein